MTRDRAIRPEFAGGLALAAWAAYLLAVSWRKWPDPLIDFGRELYLPWQINQGAVLYRDIDANYGPLSHYFNALVFRVLGTGFTQLIWINLAIFAGILVLLYRSLREAAGAGAALTGALTFVSVFSFSELLAMGNYNFVAPYSHETTHGFLVILAIVRLATLWLDQPTPGRSAGLGGLLGATLMLKVEILFTAVLVLCVTLVLAWTRRARVLKQLGVRHVLLAAAALLSWPLFFTSVLFATGRFTVSEAFLWANVGWTGLFLFPSIASDPSQALFLGTDAAMENLMRLMQAGFGSLALCGLSAALAPRVSRLRLPLAAALTATLAGGVFWFALDLRWLLAGFAIPVWLATLFVIWALDARQGDVSPTRVAARWLLMAAALGFLARMPLNPRIYQYGYCQAALGGVLTVIAMTHALPAARRLGTRALAVYAFLVLGLLGAGLFRIQQRSHGYYAARTQAVGTGADLFYALDAKFEPTGALVEDARRAIRALPEVERVFVIPEGIMVNYLVRRPTPTHVYTFNPYWLRWTPSVLEDLERRPPDAALVISRDFDDYGMGRFGESPEHGAPILSWLAARYVPIRRVGGDPLGDGPKGTILLVRRELAARLISAP